MGKLLDEPEETGIADGLCGLDLLHLAVKGGPAHPLGLVDGIADAAICSKTVAALERLADGAVIRALPLAAVGKAMGLAGGEDPATGWHVELGHEIATPWADPPVPSI